MPTAIPSVKQSSVSIQRAGNGERRVAAKMNKKKRFECNVCGRSFNLRGGLQRHYRTHTGERKLVDGKEGW